MLKIFEPTSPIVVVDVNTQKKLNRWNFTAGIVHAAMAASILCVRLFHGVPYVLKFEVMWSSIEPDALPDFLVSHQCPWNHTSNQPAVGAFHHSDIFDWFRCHREQGSSTSDVVQDDVRARLYTLQPQARGVELPVWLLLFLFELLTTTMHMGLRWPLRRRYFYFLARRMQPFRWVEYSLTSSIMLWCLMSLSRITEVYLLTSMFFLSVFLELCGGLTFEVLTFVLQRVFRTRSRQQSDEYHLVNALRWTLYALSWAAFLLSFIAIWDAFLTIIGPYFEVNNADLWSQLFLFVGIANGLLLLAYSSFPVLHAIQVTYPHRYVDVELGYIVASLVSKCVLTLTIFVAAVQRHD